MIGQLPLQYRVVEKIGEGGQGTVYRAIDTTLDRPAVVKVLRPARLAANAACTRCYPAPIVQRGDELAVSVELMTCVTTVISGQSVRPCARPGAMRVCSRCWAVMMKP